MYLPGQYPSREPPLGRVSLAAVEASFAALGMNTNLGIILLCAPLAAAAEKGGNLRSALAGVLENLDREDAAHVFEAIALANPGGPRRRDALRCPRTGQNQSFGGDA